MPKTFEASLAELENIVEQLENGDLPLEDSLKLFETGVKLSRECRDRLTDAERRIEVLMKDGEGKPGVSEFTVASQPESEQAPVKRIVFDQE